MSNEAISAAGEAHLSFLIDLRGNSEYVPTRAISLEQRGMIIDYYEALTGYGKKGIFLRRYGIRKELVPVWKDQVKRFHAMVLAHASTHHAEEPYGATISGKEDDMHDGKEDRQQFAPGDRKSFVRAYGTAIGSIFDALNKGISDFVPEEHADDFDATDALPGSTEKLEVLAFRARQGHPLWHPQDRRNYDDADTD